ncbi:MAG: hypothetical protein RIR00_2318 [Pseudomonadota bacterium]|jgi:hypothetical protein
MKTLATTLLLTVALATSGLAQARAKDCSKAAHPERCEAAQKARATCADKKGDKPAHRACIKEQMKDFPAPNKK